MGQPCEICYSSDNDVMIFGQFVRQLRHVMHRNCLTLIMGQFLESKQVDYRNWNFLREDFEGEKLRISRIRCTYCRRRGANLSCTHPGCEYNFHTKCGVANFALFQFEGKFDSFCAQHVPQPRKPPEPGDRCAVCLAPVVPEGQEFRPARAFQGPCCQNGWFHRDCIQVLANTTTHYLRCPLCRDETQFANVALLGVSLPKWRFILPFPKAVLSVPANPQTDEAPESGASVARPDM